MCNVFCRACSRPKYPSPFPELAGTGTGTGTSAFFCILWYYVRNPTVVGFPHFPLNSPWWEVLTTDTSFFCMWIVVRRVDTLLRRGYFLVGLLGAKWGRCTKNPTKIPPHTPQDEQSLHRPTPSGFALPLHGDIRHGSESRRRASP